MEPGGQKSQAPYPTVRERRSFKSQFGGDLRLCLTLAYPSTHRYRWGMRLENVARKALRLLRK